MLLLPCPIITDSSSSSSASNSRLQIHPKLLSQQELEILTTKAHLVIRMIQLKIGQDLLLQVFNKILTLASTASQSVEGSQWHNLLVSTDGFMKLLVTVSGKALSNFMDQWVCSSGVPRLSASYTFVRKKNFIELKLTQDLASHRSAKFVGSMSVIVQEFDGCFTHNIQIEDLLSTHELPCHSKIRKAKKRKVPLIHGEEIDIDISNLDNEVPILWVRVDPNFQWLRLLSLDQSDTTWQHMLRYERDATAQLQALEALEGFASIITRDCFKDAILTQCFYYQVRLQAARSLAKYITETASVGSSSSILITTFQRLFGSASQQTMVRFNDFSDIALYFLQKEFASCVTGVRNVHKQCPRESFTFIMDLFKYSDNHNNKYSADQYNSALIDALAETITPKVSVSLPVGIDFNKTPIAGLSKDTQLVLQELVQQLNIEKVMPSYRYVVTCSCLRALRALQKNGHLPSDSTIFKQYTEKCNFIDVRITAFEAIADIIQAEQNASDLDFLLQIASTEEPKVRLAVLTSLSATPPFTRRMETKLNNLEVVEKLWTFMNNEFYYDSRLRCAAVQLYSAIFGRLTPTCVPQGLGVVIDLKEKVARPNLASPITTPRTDMKPSLAPAEASISEGELTEVKVSTLASGSVDPPSSPSSPIDLQSPSDVSVPQVRVTLQEHKTAPLPSIGESSGHPHPSLSLKISTSHLKRLSPSLGAESMGSRSVTASPESALSTGVLSDDGQSLGAGLSTPSPSHSYHRHKRHKAEHKHKHKKKKGKKTKHKHKHGSREIDVEGLDS